jgi:hypothetical protein
MQCIADKKTGTQDRWQSIVSAYVDLCGHMIDVIMVTLWKDRYERLEGREWIGVIIFVPFQFRVDTKVNPLAMQLSEFPCMTSKQEVNNQVKIHQ